MDKRTLYHGEYLSMLSRDGWEYASRANARAVVVLVPVTDGGEIVLVEQYRKPVDARVLELPAGLVGDGEDADESLETAAARELEEETGYRAAVLEPVLTCPSSAGMSDEMITFFLARGLERVGPGGGDASEELDVHPVPLARVDEWLSGKLADGVLLDPKIYTALHWLATGVTPATARG